MMIKRELKVNFKSFIIWLSVLLIMFLVVYLIYPYIISDGSMQKMDEMMKLAKDQPVGCELQALACVAMILRQVYLVHSEEPIEIEHDEDLRLHKKMTAYIYEHYNEPISLDDIVASADISRSKCSVLFHKYAETSPIDFLNAYRLEMAAGQLCNTGNTVASIAFACGFNQQSYFSRMFVREYGMTPKAYRQAHQSAR